MCTREDTVDAEHLLLSLAETFDIFAVLRTFHLINIRIIRRLHRIQTVRQLYLLIVIIKSVVIFYLDLLRLKVLDYHFLASLSIFLFDVEILQELFVRRARKINIRRII